MKIIPVPSLDDNYAYLIVDESTKVAAAVDPVEPEKIISKANEIGADLKLVLTTHHHWDHSGGNEKIKELVPGIKVVGGSLDNVGGCTDKVENWDRLTLGSDVNILCLHTPWSKPEVLLDLVESKCQQNRRAKEISHTKGHISYFVTNKAEEEPSVFTGDTLFIAGCGKFFEGTAEDMYQSLCVTLGSLPKSTKVFCGHEYTEKNLKFASSVEPDNVEISQKLQWAQQQRKANLPTIPSTIGEEFDTNPFMRVDFPEVQAKVGHESAVEALNELRKLKDNWRG